MLQTRRIFSHVPPHKLARADIAAWVFFSIFFSFGACKLKALRDGERGSNSERGRVVCNITCTQAGGSSCPHRISSRSELLSYRLPHLQAWRLPLLTEVDEKRRIVGKRTAKTAIGRNISAFVTLSRVAESKNMHNDYDSLLHRQKQGHNDESARLQRDDIGMSPRMGASLRRWAYGHFETLPACSLVTSEHLAGTKRRSGGSS
jgi:hypothetical protein